MDSSSAAPPADPDGRGLPPEWIDALRSALARPVRLVGGLAGIVLIVLTWFFVLRPGTGPPPRLELPRIGELDTTTPTAAQPPGDRRAEPTSPSAGTGVTVHVAGAVNHPGVYVLAPGSRVADAVTAAGGAHPRAALERVNLAATVGDGERWWIPGTDDPQGVGDPGIDPGAQASPPTTRGPVDVNAASLAELDELPGIGPAIAQAIVSYREQSGPFRSVTQLLDVPGIGPAKLDTLRPLVTV